MLLHWTPWVWVSPFVNRNQEACPAYIRDCEDQMRVLLGLCRPVDGSRCSAVDSRLQAGWTPASSLARVGAALVAVTPPAASRSTPQWNGNLRAMEEPSAIKSKLAPFLFKTRLFNVKIYKPNEDLYSRLCTKFKANISQYLRSLSLYRGFFPPWIIGMLQTTLLHPLNTSSLGQARNVLPFQSNPIYCPYLNFFCCP